MLILIIDAFDQSLPEKLEQFGEVTNDLNRLPEAEVVLVRSKTTCDKEFIQKAKKLQLIIRGGVGLDNIDSEYAKSKGIAVSNTPNASSIAVAELAFSMMTSITCHIIEAHQSMSEGKWLKKELKRTELYGKTLCCIGVGHIATELAVRAKVFGMKVIAYRKSNKPWKHGEVFADIKEAVSQADFVSLHTPLTEGTHHIICSEVIQAMTPGTVIINTGRSGCIDETALAEALHSGQVGAYATDVWPHDPPPEDYPLLNTPNTYKSPHLGASTRENLLRIGDEVVEVIKHYLFCKKDFR